jgi:hypothetical protein
MSRLRDELIPERLKILLVAIEREDAPTADMHLEPLLLYARERSRVQRSDGKDDSQVGEDPNRQIWIRISTQLRRLRVTVENGDFTGARVFLADAQRLYGSISRSV